MSSSFVKGSSRFAGRSMVAGQSELLNATSSGIPSLDYIIGMLAVFMAQAIIS